MRLENPVRRRIPILLIVAIVAVVAASPAMAQSRPTSGSDRMFLTFPLEATVVDQQWWEGRLDISEADQIDRNVLGLVFALSPWDNVEFGGRVGFGNTDTPPGVPQGRGATDFEGWGKWHFGASGDRTEFAAGALLTVPTGDDTAGLGFDAWALGGFFSVRHRLRAVILSGNIGARFNGNGNTLGVRVDGKTSGFLGFGVLAPIADHVALIGEIIYETRRFDQTEDDSRVLGGVNWRVGNRGLIRGAVDVGLTDGAPDVQVLVGYAFVF